MYFTNIFLILCIIKLSKLRYTSPVCLLFLDENVLQIWTLLKWAYASFFPSKSLTYRWALTHSAGRMSSIIEPRGGQNIIGHNWNKPLLAIVHFLGPGARFSKAPESFRARKAIFRSSVSKNGEVYTPETSCMKETSLHL